MKHPGRPVGSVENPSRLLKRRLIESAKLSSRSLRLLERVVAGIESKMTDSGGILDTDLERLLKIMTSIDRTVEATGKLLTQKNSGIPTEEPPRSTEEVLAQLTKGKK